MCALELVEDRATKAPLGKDRVGGIFKTIYKAGVMVRISGNNMIFSPPLVLTADDVAQILGATEQGLASAG